MTSLKAVNEATRIVTDIAWRNIWRNPIRSCLTVFSLAIGITLIVFYAALLKGMIGQMEGFVTDIALGDFQIHRQTYIDDNDPYAAIPARILDTLETHYPQLNFAPRLYAAALASSQEQSVGVLIKAIDEKREGKSTLLLEQIGQGELDFNHIKESKDGIPIYPVIIGKLWAKNLALSIGDEVVLMGQAWDGSIANGLFYVAAIMGTIDPGFDRSGLLMSQQTFNTYMQDIGAYHEIIVSLPDTAEPDLIKADMNGLLKRLQETLDVERDGALVLRSWQEINKPLSDMINLSQTMIGFIGGIIAFLASLGVLNTLLMAIHERRKELGVLLVIGMKKSWVFSMVLVESLLLALWACGIGCALGYLVVSYFSINPIDLSSYLPEGYDFAGMSFAPVMNVEFDVSSLAQASSIMLGVCLLASLIPSWQTLRLQPIEVVS